MSTGHSAKQLKRREVLQRLRQAADSDPAQLRSAALRGKLAPILAGAPRSIAIYAPLPHEVNLLPLVQEYPQHQFAFPLCLPAHQLEFRIVTDTRLDLRPGKMGIPEPAPHTRAVKPEEIDLLIVPGVAFTLAGGRLGYGGGYYDRFLPRCQRARILALAFAEQLESALPTEPHDLSIPEIIHL